MYCLCASSLNYDIILVCILSSGSRTPCTRSIAASNEDLSTAQLVDGVTGKVSDAVLPQVYHKEFAYSSQLCQNLL